MLQTALADGAAAANIPTNVTAPAHRARVLRRRAKRGCGLWCCACNTRAVREVEPSALLARWSISIESSPYRFTLDGAPAATSAPLGVIFGPAAVHKIRPGLEVYLKPI